MTVPPPSHRDIAETITNVLGSPRAVEAHSVTEEQQQTLIMAEVDENGDDRRGVAQADTINSANAAQRPEEATVGPGDTVDHFTIIRSLGRGANGEVFLARDTLLGRRVALKLLHPDALSHAGALERFEFEARTTARFSHPHIVTVHFVGNHHGRPYVALEYLEGETLRKRMDNRRFSSKEIMRVGLAIAEALQEAHKHGILHRDLKPENVILPVDGRLRVVDFGLATQLNQSQVNELASAGTFDFDGDEHQTIPESKRSKDGPGLFGTPLYMSPEQWRSQEPTEGIDIWALGILLHELVGGKHPYENVGDTGSYLAIATRVCQPEPVAPPTNTADTPERLLALIEACVDKDPAGRPSASEVVAELRAMLHVGRWQLDAEASPFRGLLPFTEEQADLFFGRDSEVAQLVELMRSEPVLPVVGPSGAGKSSFVRAGVIPRLLEQQRWLIIELRPGRTPFDTLARRLTRALERGMADSGSAESSSSWTPLSGRGADDRHEQLARSLRQHPGRLALQLLTIAEHHHVNVLLFVDQTEELDTLTDGADTQNRFAEAVATAAEDPTMPVRVIFTLREDFLGRAARHRALRRVLRRLTLLQTPDRGNLRQILTEPVRAVGYEYDDPHIVDDMISRVSSDPAALAVLQFAATALWERRDKKRRLLLRSAYDAIGGVEGALAHQANRLLGSLSNQELRVARALLLRLVTPQRTRRSVPREELVAGLGHTGVTVLNSLIEERAVIVGRRAMKNADAEVELVHESLIRSWKQLASWLDESKGQRAFLEELERAAELWNKRGRRPEEVWKADALAEAVRKASEIDHLPAVAREFLDAGQRRQSRRSRTRRIAYVTAMGALGIIAAALGVQQHRTNNERMRAERGEHRAKQESAASLREIAAQDILKGNRVAATMRLRASLELHDSLLARALLQQANELPRLWSDTIGNTVVTVQFSPTTQRLTVAGAAGVITSFEPWTRKVTTRKVKVSHILQSFAFSPDGQRMATIVDGGAVILRRTDDWTQVWKTTGSKCRRGIFFSPDGSRVGCSTAQGSVHVFSADTGKLTNKLQGSNSPSFTVDISSDGRWLASPGSRGQVRIWEMPSAKLARTIHAGDAFVRRIRFRPRSDIIVTSGGDHVIRAWHASTGKLVRVIARRTDRVTAMDFSKDGRWFAWGAATRLILKRWEKAALPIVVTEHNAEVHDIAFSPDGKLLASGAGDGSVQLFETSKVTRRQQNHGHRGFVTGVSFSKDGNWLFTGSVDRTWQTWNVRTGQQPRAPVQVGMKVVDMSLSPDGSKLAMSGVNGLVKIFDTADSRLIRVLAGHEGSVWAVAFSPNGERLASSGRDNVINVWNPKTGALVRHLEGHSDCVYGLAYDNKQRLVSSSADGTVRRWDEHGRDTILDRTVELRGVTCHPREPWCATTGLWGNVFVVNEKQKSHRDMGKLPVTLRWMQLSPDGETLGIAGARGRAWLWNVRSSKKRALLGHSPGTDINHVAFSPDGTLIATAGDDETVRLWHTDSGRTAWGTVVLVGSPNAVLTHRGWETPRRDGGYRSLPAGGCQKRAETAWIKRLGDVVHAAVSTNGGRMCLIGDAGGIELWDTELDRRIARGALPSSIARRKLPKVPLVVTGTGCGALLPDKSVHWLSGSSNKLTLVHEGATAIGAQVPIEGSVASTLYAKDGLLVATSGGVISYDNSGQKHARVPYGRGATALLLTSQGELAVGMSNGRLRMYPTTATGTALKDNHGLLDPPHASIVTLTEAAGGILAVGAQDGTLGLWDMRQRTRLKVTHLHGPVTDMLVGEHKLLAASALGDVQALDLSIFEKDHCTVLRDVWKSAPVVWRAGHAVTAPAPAGHPCLRR